MKQILLIIPVLIQLARLSVQGTLASAPVDVLRYTAAALSQVSGESDDIRKAIVDCGGDELLILAISRAVRDDSSPDLDRKALPDSTWLLPALETLLTLVVTDTTYPVRNEPTIARLVGFLTAGVAVVDAYYPRNLRR